MKANCLACRRCLCRRCHPDGPCERVDRGRRFFLLGALVAPVAPRLVVPSAGEVTVHSATFHMGFAIETGQLIDFQALAVVMKALYSAVGAGKPGAAELLAAKIIGTPP